ncbi:epidermal retinol dehydrogenase 2 isoform X2 [Folsomia candida]|uniref:epidermal retinol dehydrogenase 2 isoform X2 n=1 Tax=Folsomia candida TaxID=158441 RepID=UPI000B90722D|nr:epidermal retinol dehydrogenase 2 isoform X2 [Folsomia candida]
MEKAVKIASPVSRHHLLKRKVAAKKNLTSPTATRILTVALILIVTGSGNGIGREICLQLANSGAKIVCWDIHKGNNDALVKSLRKLGAFAYGYMVDVSDRSTVECFADKVRKEVGEVTIIINNAGVAPCQEFLKCNPQLVEHVFKVNVLSHFWILQEFLPNMIECSKGHVVTMCSFAGLKATRNMVPYNGSKAAIHGYLESLKSEIRHHPKKPDIKFTTVYPSAVNTRLFKGLCCRFRFPYFTPVLEPEYVARHLLNGLKREIEYVYCPPHIPLYLFLENLIPNKARGAVTDFLMPLFEPISTTSNKSQLDSHCTSSSL